MLIVMSVGVAFAEDTDNSARPEISNDKTTQILDRIAQDNPAEAARLRELREEDPDEFRAELREFLSEKWRQHDRGMERFEKSRRGSDGQPDDDIDRIRTGRRSRSEMEPLSKDMAGRMKDRMREQLQAKEKELIEWLAKNEPETAAELAELKDKDMRSYARRVAMETRKYREVIEAEKTDPAYAEVLKNDIDLKEKRDELLKKLAAETDEDEKEELLEELNDIVSERFDVVLKKKQIRLEQLTKRLEELKEQVKQSESELDAFKENKSDYIDDRVESLTSRSKDFKWE